MGEYVCPGFMIPESNSPVVLVTVWGVVSLFTHVTVFPEVVLKFTGR